MRTRRTYALIASTIVLGGVLAGCSGGEDEAPAEDPAASESTGGDTGQVEEEGVVTEDGDSVVTTYQSVPPDFPEQVPVLDEDEATGSVTEYDGLTSYSVVVESDGEPREVLQEAATMASDAGLQGDPEVQEEGDLLLPVALTSDDPELTVVINAGPVDGGGTVLTYTVEVS